MLNCNIIIADDHSLIREGLKVILNTKPEFTVIGEATNGKELLKMTYSLKNCDVLILDICMPIMDGLSTMKEIKIKYPNIKILVLSMFKDSEHYKHAKASGASGYLAKEDAGDELVYAINTIYKNKNYVSPSIANIVFDRHIASLENDEYPSLEIITKREKQVLKLIAQGLPGKNISSELKISIHTVKNHRVNLSKKLGLNHTAALVKYALAKNLI